MALEFTKLSEVPLMEEEIAVDATVLVENNGEIVRAPKKSVGGGGGGVTVIVTEHTVEENGYTNNYPLLGRYINEEYVPYENESEFIDDYCNKRLMLNFEGEGAPSIPYPFLITGYSMDGYGAKYLFFSTGSDNQSVYPCIFNQDLQNL
jgi:hypothetical protein